MHSLKLVKIYLKQDNPCNRIRHSLRLIAIAFPSVQ